MGRAKHRVNPAEQAEEDFALRDVAIGEDGDGALAVPVALADAVVMSVFFIRLGSTMILDFRTAEGVNPTVMVDGPGPTLCFHPGRVEGRNRWHLDLVGRSKREEIARLCALGARVREEHARWTTLLDPEGNPFCVLDP